MIYTSDKCQTQALNSTIFNPPSPPTSQDWYKYIEKSFNFASENHWVHCRVYFWADYQFDKKFHEIKLLLSFVFSGYANNIHRPTNKVIVLYAMENIFIPEMKRSSFPSTMSE